MLGRDVEPGAEAAHEDSERPDVAAWLRERVSGICAVVERLGRNSNWRSTREQQSLALMVGPARHLVQRLLLLGPAFAEDVRRWDGGVERVVREVNKREWGQLEEHIKLLERGTGGQVPQPWVRKRVYELIDTLRPKCAGLPGFEALVERVRAVDRVAFLSLSGRLGQVAPLPTPRVDASAGWIDESEQILRQIEYELGQFEHFWRDSPEYRALKLFGTSALWRISYFKLCRKLRLARKKIGGKVELRKRIDSCRNELLKLRAGGCRIAVLDDLEREIEELG